MNTRRLHLYLQLFAGASCSRVNRLTIKSSTGHKNMKTLHDMSCLTQTTWSLCFSLSSPDLGVTVIVAGNSALISGVILGENEVLRSDLISLVGQAEAWRLFWFVFLGQQHHIRVCVRLQWSQRRKTNASEDESEAIGPPTSDSTPTWGDLFDSEGTDSSVLSKVPQRECWLWIFDERGMQPGLYLIDKRVRECPSYCKEH